MNIKVEKELERLSDKNYRAFSSKLLPGIDNILGVRLPLLRKLAKKISSDTDFAYKFLGENCTVFEEIMLQGMVIGYLKVSFEEKIKLIENFVPKIDNWSVCDSFCTGLKFIKTNKEKTWEFLQKYFYSKKEFEIRFALVTVLNYFIEDDYINKIFYTLTEINSDKKYVVMAEGWLLSFCYKKYSEETIDFIDKSSISDEVKKIALKKIKELANSLKSDYTVR